MKKTWLGIIIVCTSLFTYSCASLPEPDNADQTLIIGIARTQGVNTISSNAGIEITLQDISSNKTYTIRSRSEGLFYSTGIPPGVYRFTRLESPNASGGTSWSTPDSPPRIEILNGRVNNLGIITLVTVSGTRVNFQWSQGYDQARALFREQHGSSTWNQREWINNGIGRANVTASPAVLPTQPSTSPSFSQIALSQ